VIFQAWAGTDIGKHRVLNEDCYLVDEETGLILVLDGMGGHVAGEVASHLAMETISAFYRRYSGSRIKEIPVAENYDQAFSYQSNLLQRAVLEANRVVLEKSLENQQLSGMGSTVAGMAIRDFTASAVNVGDSRIYLIRDNNIEQISVDHTLAEDQVGAGAMTPEEANDSELRHVLSSVLGVESEIQLHMDELSTLSGDIFLMCTDGLTAVMKDEEILSTVMKQEIGPETIQRLIEQANVRGGPDNVTVALIRVHGGNAAQTG
jgi:serine/threonine protein phosphatase PrpC